MCKRVLVSYMTVSKDIGTVTLKLVRRKIFWTLVKRGEDLTR